jgi:Terminase large subunit, T4likevirus-type, N-terminal
MVSSSRLGSDLALALDPVVLAKQLGLTADPWQADLLRSEARQRILLCCRQAGKSTVSALLALHTALYRPPALVLLLSPSLRQSQELYRKVRTDYRALGEAAPGVVEETALRIELANGSRIVSLPGKESTIRGFSGTSLLIVDEASRVPDALYHAVRPMLAVSGGQLVLLSTPFGKRGFFHHEWAEGGGDWHRVKITANDCPRIDPVWLARERDAIGEWWFRQEYLCEFVDTADQVFGLEVVMRALSPEVQPLFERTTP